MTANLSGYFRAASTASALESGSQPPGGWISAASTPASFISVSNCSAVNCSTLRCRPVVGVTVFDQMWTWASMILMTFLSAKFLFHFSDVERRYYAPPRKEHEHA